MRQQFKLIKNNPNPQFKILQWKMKLVKQFLRNFDMFSAPATLRTKGKPETSSSFAGFISFIIGCFFAYIFYTQVMDIFSFKDISSSQSFEMLSTREPRSENITFAISMNLNVTEIMSYFHIYAIPMINSNYNETIQLYPCREEQWEKLGADYQEQFKESSLHNFLCPDKISSLKLNNAEFQEGFQSIIVIIQPCSLENCQSSLYPPLVCICRSQSEIEQFIHNQVANSGFVGVWVYFLDQAVHNQAKDPIHYFVNTDTFVSFTQTRGQMAIIQFNSFQINTDVGVWPFAENQVAHGHSIDYTKYLTKQITKFGQEYARLELSMCRKKFKYQRKVGKIDEMLSYVGGLFSLVITFLTFFIYSYNQYRYEISVAEYYFNYDEKGNKIRERDFNFVTYIRYSIYDWISTFLVMNLKEAGCQQIDQTRQEIIKQMDVSNLYKKLQQMQTCLFYLMNQNDKMCLSLVEPPSLKTVKKKRLITQYYDAIVQGEQEVTLQDLSLQQIMGRKKMKFIGKDQRKQKGKNKQENEMEKQDRIKQQQEQILTTILASQVSVKSINDTNIFSLIERVTQKYPKIKQQADQLRISEQLSIVEHQISNAFLKLNPQSRIRICKRIPIKILYRLIKLSKVAK